MSPVPDLHSVWEKQTKGKGHARAARAGAFTAGPKSDRRSLVFPAQPQAASTPCPPWPPPTVLSISAAPARKTHRTFYLCFLCHAATTDEPLSQKPLTWSLFSVSKALNTRGAALVSEDDE